MSANILKLIAAVTMLIDHIGYVFFKGIPEYREFGMVMRMIGRVAFPIYCFLLVEGFTKTRNVYKYALRLLLLAIVSEVPFNLCFYGTVWHNDYQNVFFTLLLSLACMWCVSRFEAVEKIAQNNLLMWFIRLGIPAVFCLVAVGLKCDYTYKGILYVMIFYYLRFDKTFMLFVQAAAQLLFSSVFTSVFALVPIAFYNGKLSNIAAFDRKNRSSEILKWGFYLFYPFHMIILWAIARQTGI